MYCIPHKLQFGINITMNHIRKTYTMESIYLRTSVLLI